MREARATKELFRHSARYLRPGDLVNTNTSVYSQIA